jgi:hypothetical protein
MAQGNRPPSLGREDGFYAKGKVLDGHKTPNPIGAEPSATKNAKTTSDRRLVVHAASYIRINA